MVKIEDLEKAYNNHQLTEYLKLLTDEELRHMMDRILCDDIIGIRINIYDALYNEFEYRNDEDLAFHMFMSKK